MAARVVTRRTSSRNREDAPPPLQTAASPAVSSPAPLPPAATSSSVGSAGSAASAPSFQAAPTAAAVGSPPAVRQHDASLAELAGSMAWILLGCCANAVFLEAMIKEAPDVTNLIGLVQFLFMAALGAPRHVVWPRARGAPWRWVPQLRYTVPLTRWIGVVILFFATSLMTNAAFRFHVSMPVQIVLRSASLCVSMLFGVFYFKRRYSVPQVVAVLCVTLGIILVTISTVRSKPAASATNEVQEGHELETLIGLSMLMVSMLLAGLLGAIQEEVFRAYGKLSEEAVFYSHFLGLPAFLFLWNDLARSIARCNSCGDWTVWPGTTASDDGSSWMLASSPILVPKMWVLMALNVITQYACLRGVYGMAARTSNLTVNVALSVRKAVSLLISIVYFGNPFTAGHMVGAILVFGGTLLYRETPAAAAAAAAAAKPLVDAATAPPAGAAARPKAE